MCMLKPLPTNLCDSMLYKATIEDLKVYKDNALKILRENSQYATAKIVEELFDQQIMFKELEDILPEHIGV